MPRPHQQQQVVRKEMIKEQGADENTEDILRGVQAMGNLKSKLQYVNLGEDPFITEQGSFECVYAALERYYTINGFPDYSGNIYAEYGILRDVWHPLCLTDPASFSTTVLIAQSLRPDAHLYHDRIAWLKMHCVRLINEALADPSRSRTDAIIAAVVSMLMYECIFGHQADTKVHIRGLGQLVEMRGGSLSPDISWVVRRSVLWIDRIQAHLSPKGEATTSIESWITNKTYAPDPREHTRSLGHALDPTHPAREALTFYQNDRSEDFIAIHRLVVGIWSPGQDLIDALEQLRGCTIDIEHILKQPHALRHGLRELHGKMLMLEGPLLELGSRYTGYNIQSPIETHRQRELLVHESLRLSALLIIHTCAVHYFSSEISRTRRDHGAQTLQMLEFEKLLPSDPVVLLWTLVSAIPSVEEGFRSKIVSIFGQLRVQLKLRSPIEVRESISDIMYSSPVHDEGIFILWESLNGFEN